MSESPSAKVIKKPESLQEVHKLSSRKQELILAEQMKKIADELGLAGGGHPTAASLSGKGVPFELAKKFVESLRLTLP